MNERIGTTGVDYVIAIDTDSLYINFGPLVKQAGFDGTFDKLTIVEFIDEYCKKTLLPLLAEGYAQLQQYLKAPQQKISMKREIIADKGIWTGKKHYILNVHNSEGTQYAEPKLKMKGIEAVRSSTPQICRDGIKRALGIIMNKNEADLQKFIKDFRSEHTSQPFEKIAFPRGVQGIGKYKEGNGYAKGTPIHVKGAILFNERLKALGLTGAPIQDGDKIRFAYLKQPNPLHDSVISSPNYLPPEFGLDKYIDRELQFEKSFLEALRTITAEIGWSVEETASLARFGL